MSKIKIGNVKGQDGFSPTVKENLNNTNDDYRLDVTDKNGTFTTPNLKADNNYIAETYATKVQVDELKSDLVDIGQDFRSDNLINRNTIIHNAWINADGSVIADPDYNVTPFINVSKYVGKRIYFIPNGNYGSGYQCRRMVAFDKDETVVESKDVWMDYDIPSNVSYMRLCFNHAMAVAPLLTINGIDDKTYRDYYIPQLPKIKEDMYNALKNLNLAIVVEKPYWEKRMDENAGWFKCERIVIKHDIMPTYAGTWTANIIRSDSNPNGIWVVDSAQWMKQCAYIGGENNQKLVYSFKRHAIEYSTMDHFDADTIVLLSLDGGILHGYIAEYITQSVEEGFYKHRYRNISEGIFNNIVMYRVAEFVPKITKNSFTFGYFSDNHGRGDIVGYPNLTPKYLNKIDELINLDCIVNAGDIIASSDAMTIKDAIYSASTQNMEFRSPYKQIIAKGNHDMNGHTVHNRQEKSWTLTHEMFYAINYRQFENDHSVVWGSKEDLYFYKDFEDKKIRVIVLNTNDCGEETITEDGIEYMKYDTLTTCGLRQAQLDWLCETAFNFSNKENATDWHTMIVCHIGVREGITDNHPSVLNANVVRDIIKAFKNGQRVNSSYTDSTNVDGLFTVSINHDFTTQGTMPFIGVFSGHNHCDRLYTNEDFNQFTILAGYPDKGYDSVDRMINDYTEFAFDIVNVNRESRRIDFVRCGAGDYRYCYY